MPLDLLLLTSLKRETRISDSGNTVAMTLKSDEQVLFFDLDRDVCALKQLILNQQDWEDKKICDGLVYFTDGVKWVLCFVELKGQDIERAAKQIVNTYKFMRKHLEDCLKRTDIGKGLIHKIQWRAYILQHRTSSSPSLKSNHDKIRKRHEVDKELRSNFSKHCIDKNSDIGKFIRGD